MLPTPGVHSNIFSNPLVFLTGKVCFSMCLMGVVQSHAANGLFGCTDTLNVIHCIYMTLKFYFDNISFFVRIKFNNLVFTYENLL